MNSITLKDKQVLIYDDLDSEPCITRWHKFQKFMFIDSQIGSNLSDINKHLSILPTVADDSVKFSNAVNNFYQLFGFIENDINVEHLAFAVMVHSIGGVECNDLSKSGLERTLKELSDLGLTQKVLKKKLRKYTKAYNRN